MLINSDVLLRIYPSHSFLLIIIGWIIINLTVCNSGNFETKRNSWLITKRQYQIAEVQYILNDHLLFRAVPLKLVLNPERLRTCFTYFYIEDDAFEILKYNDLFKTMTGRIRAVSSTLSFGSLVYYTLQYQEHRISCCYVLYLIMTTENV